jgi:hypothetical protein
MTPKTATQHRIVTSSVSMHVMSARGLAVAASSTACKYIKEWGRTTSDE